jgi:hypothetical protein
VRGERVRLRVGRRAAALHSTHTVVDDRGRLTVRGTIERRARGTVRVQVAYLADATSYRTLTYRARIHNGRWRINRLLPTRAAHDGGLLTATYAGSPAVSGARIAAPLPAGS